jgi:hypothetical protein
LSNQELVHAYSAGQISRRTLIRRLVAGGISLSAAVSYAHLLAPDRAAAGAEECGENYPTIAMRVLSRDLKDVVRDKKLKIRVRPSEQPMDLEFTVTTKVVGQDVELGSKRLVIDTTNATRVSIPLDGVGPLRGRDRARVKVTAVRWTSGPEFPLCNPFPGTMDVTGVLR